MKKIERSQLAQNTIAGGSKGNTTATAIASDNGKATAKVVIREKVVVKEHSRH
ncbi:hypothetical protein [Paraburkholderia diazotrophica]|uniref:hypothetical protein n=1 Tax=Paraburkholderia diazotrophica TaxID=667676 RepID=UPI003175F88E